MARFVWTSKYPPQGRSPLIRLPPPSPRRRGEGTSCVLSVPRAPLAGHVPSLRFYGERERVRVRASHPLLFAQFAANGMPSSVSGNSGTGTFIHLS
ncbi:hypothetical protein E0J21_01425 [Rhizobium laguerreae]|nr:hypothetical protein [Rhizobium laguerreae]TBY13616.1 hypothetical protein E0J21_01425 [Rhizobium laguerreae]